MHPSVESQIALLESMVKHLEDYLDEDKVFKTITYYPPEGEHLAKLTIGALLELLDDLSRRDDLTPEQRQKVAELAKQVETIRSYRRADWLRKIARELKAYTDSWRWYLQSVEDGSRQAVREYPSEVRTRLRIQRLLDDAGDAEEIKDLKGRVVALDRLLRSYWQRGDFVLPNEDPERYQPPERYWWLYGHPRVVE